MQVTKHIQAEDEIPPAFQTSFPSYQGKFPYTLLIPKDRKLKFFKRSRKLVYLLDEELGVMETARNVIKTISIPFGGVLYFEHGRVLLDSWLKIVSKDGEILLNFNTANTQRFGPIIDQIRPDVGAEPGMGSATGMDEIGKSVFDFLATENFKFMNYGKSVVRAGDPVVCVAYQPGYVHAYGPLKFALSRRKTPNQLLVLTEKELILIKEDKRFQELQENGYDGIFTYIHRDQIRDVQFIPSLDSLDCLLRVHLPNDLQITAELLLNNRDLGPLRNSLERS